MTTISLQDVANDLIAYLRYYSTAKQLLPPLFPFCAQEVLCQDLAKAKQKIEQWQKQQDPYLQWLLASAEIDWQQALISWQPFFTATFASLIREYQS